MLFVPSLRRSSPAFRLQCALSYAYHTKCSRLSGKKRSGESAKNNSPLKTVQHALKIESFRRSKDYAVTKHIIRKKGIYGRYIKDDVLPFKENLCNPKESHQNQSRGAKNAHYPAEIIRRVGQSDDPRSQHHMYNTQKGAF